jgi:two-component system nitrogen regulation response regulator NtrX
MEAERFRQDLYYRLHVIPLKIPPLRDRKEDIPLLSKRFLKEFSVKEGVEEKALMDDALGMLMCHDWPGNVRELKNIIERLVIMTPGNMIKPEDVPPFIKTASQESPDDAILNLDSFRTARAEFEKKFIARKLQEAEGNISKTADLIGLERSNLHRKIKGYGLDTKKE